MFFTLISPPLSSYKKGLIWDESVISVTHPPKPRPALLSRLPRLGNFGNIGNPNGNLYRVSFSITSSCFNFLTGRQITRLANP